MLTSLASEKTCNGTYDLQIDEMCTSGRTTSRTSVPVSNLVSLLLILASANYLFGHSTYKTALMLNRTDGYCQTK